MVCNNRSAIFGVQALQRGSLPAAQDNNVLSPSGRDKTMEVISTAEHSDFVSGQYCAAGRGSSYVPGVGHGMPERWSWISTSIGLIQYHTTALHHQIASQERAAPETVYEDTRQASTSATAKSFVISTSVVAAQ